MITKERLDEIEAQLSGFDNLIVDREEGAEELVALARLGLQYEDLKREHDKNIVELSRYTDVQAFDHWKDRAEKAEPLAKWARDEAAPTLRAYSRAGEEEFGAFVYTALETYPKEAT